MILIRLPVLVIKIWFFSSGQIHIITAEHEDAESESYENIITPPRINYQPNTSVLDVSASSNEI
jgi:hypothetical protein